MSSDEDVRLEQLISTLAAATTGDLSVRVPLQEDGRPSLIELEYAVNALLEDLELARLESDQRQQQIQQQAARLLEQQRELVMALSTPAIMVWPRVLAVPIIGEVGPERATGMSESVLATVVANRTTHVILDLTGARQVTPQTARSLLRIAQAIQLLGARCLVTGVNAQLAGSLVSSGIDLQSLVPLPSLSDALLLVLRERGLQLVKQT